jgi:hypothetical protein
MKNLLSLPLILLVAVMLLLPVAASAQNAYNHSDKVISAGVGLGTFYGAFGSTDIPPIFVAFETGLPAQGLEKVTIGGIAGYSGSSEDFVYGKWKYTYIFLGVTGNYHFIEKNRNFDAYAGIGLGYDIVSSSVTYNNGYDAAHYSFSGGVSYFAYDVHVGARYYFSPRLAAMAELGYGFGLFRVGLSYKL